MFEQALKTVLVPVLQVYLLQLTYLICQFIDGCGMNVLMQDNSSQVRVSGSLTHIR